MMMQGTLIDDKVWKTMFHTAAVLFSLKFAHSLYQQHVATRAPTLETLKELQSSTDSKDRDGQIKAIRQLAGLLDEESKTKKGGAKVSLQSNFNRFVACTLTNPKDTEVVTAALKVISRCCLDDVECKAAFVQANGIRRLVAVLQSSHETSDTRLMEDVAATLKDVTLIPETDVVFSTDEPRSSVGVQSLLRMSNLPSMLRTLDPRGRLTFLQAMTGVFANICTLGRGCRVIGKGLDGKSGAQFFTALLDHSNSTVSENSVRVLKFMCLHELELAQDVLVTTEVVARLLQIVSIRREPTSVGPVLTIFKVLICDSSKAIREKFLREFMLQDGADALFTMWCTGGDKLCRDRSEALVHMIEDDATWGGAVRKLRDQYRSLIHKRKETDEKEQKQKMQQMKQQMMFQQMMMEQMMGGGGGGMPGEEDFE